MMATLGPKPGSKRLYAWAIYAVAALVLTALIAGVVSTLVTPTEARAIWFSAGLACLLQLIAFAGLLWVRNEAQLLLAGWLIGMALRFGALGGVAWWLSRSAALPRTAALLSLVGFVFLLLVLEPFFLRWDLRKS
jgi:hypothetical protein